MPGKFEKIGNAFGAVGRAVERKRSYSDPAVKLLHQSCHLIMIVAVVFGIVLPLARFEVILLTVVALALCTIGMAIFAKGARTAPIMLLRAFLAILLLGLTMTAQVILAG